MLQTRLSSRREEGLQSSRVSQTERRLVSAIRGVWLSACGKERRTRGGRVTPFPRLQEPSGVSAATSPMTTASCNGVQVMIVLPFEWQAEVLGVLTSAAGTAVVVYPLLFR